MPDNSPPKTRVPSDRRRRWRAKSLREQWGSLFAGRLCGVGLLSVGLWVISLELAPEARESFFVFVALYATLATGVLCGLATALVPALARCEDDETAAADCAHEALRHARLRSWAAAAVFVAAAMITAPTDPLLAFSALGLLLQPLHLGASARLAKGDSYALLGVEIAGRITSVGLILQLARLDSASVGGFVLAWTLPQAAAAAGYTKTLRGPLRHALGLRGLFTRRARPTGARLLSTTIRWTSAGDFVRALYFQGSPLLVSALSVHGGFASFGLAHRIFATLAFAPSALATLIAGPLAGAGGDTLLAQLSRRRSKVLVVTTALLASLACSGLAYLPMMPHFACRLLAVLCIALPAMSFAAVAIPALLARGHERVVFKISLQSLALTAALLVAGVTWRGITGAAWALVLGECAVAFLSVRAFRSLVMQGRESYA